MTEEAYAELVTLARRYAPRGLSPAELVHIAWIRLRASHPCPRSWWIRAMESAAIDLYRSRRARGDGRHVSLGRVKLFSADPREGLELRIMAESLEPVSGAIVAARVAGLTQAEAADAAGVCKVTAQRRLRELRLLDT